METTYRVLRIEEQMYGCEELPAGQPVLCDVTLADPAGERRTLPYPCLLYTSPSPRDKRQSRMPSSA